MSSLVGMERGGRERGGREREEEGEMTEGGGGLALGAEAEGRDGFLMVDPITLPASFEAESCISADAPPTHPPPTTPSPRPSSPVMSEDAAAVKIQASVRGYLSRKRMELILRKTRAATAFQAAW